MVSLITPLNTFVEKFISLILLNSKNHRLKPMDRVFIEYMCALRDRGVLEGMV